MPRHFAMPSAMHETSDAADDLLGRCQYLRAFGLQRRPFAGTPDTDAYYPSRTHHAALSQLCGAVHGDEALALLVGPTGTGKTLLSHLLLESQPRRRPVVMVANTRFASTDSIFQTLLHEMGCDTAGDVHFLRRRLTDELLDAFRTRGATLILIDEAQNLKAPHLEELRLLTNLEGRRQRAVQVVLFAGPQLLTTLGQAACRAFVQRIAVFAALARLGEEETVEYVRHHLAAVGGSADSIFTAGAYSELCQRSGGVPRRISQLCHLALMGAYRGGAGTVDGDDVVAADVHLLRPDAVPLRGADGPVARPQPPATVEEHHPLSGDGGGALRSDHAGGPVREPQPAPASRHGNDESAAAAVEIGPDPVRRERPAAADADHVAAAGGSAEQPTVIELDLSRRGAASRRPA